MERDRLDGFDVRIIQELTQAQTLLAGHPGLAESYREVARKVALPPSTVRSRIQRMYRTGVLRGSSLYPNPTLLGLRVGAYTFDVAPTLRKREVVERLKLLDGVWFLQNFSSALVGLVFVYRAGDTAEQKLAEIDRIAGAIPWRFADLPFPFSPIVFSPSDRVLVGRLVRGSFSSYDGLARDTGLSVRTIKRKLGRLTRGMALFSLPTIDYRAVRGAVPADVVVAYSGPTQRSESEPEILRTLREYVVFAGIWSSYSLYSMMLPSVSLLAEIVDRLGRVPGVESLQSGFVDEHIDQSSIFGRFLERSPEVSRTGPIETGAVA